jgi:hypothetical protein
MRSEPHVEISPSVAGLGLRPPWQEIQGNETPKLRILSLVDHTHPAAADLMEYAVMGDGLPHGLGRSGHWREC